MLVLTMLHPLVDFLVALLHSRLFPGDTIPGLRIVGRRFRGRLGSGSGRRSLGGGWLLALRRSLLRTLIEGAHRRGGPQHTRQNRKRNDGPCDMHDRLPLLHSMSRVEDLFQRSRRVAYNSLYAPVGSDTLYVRAAGAETTLYGGDHAQAGAHRRAGAFA